MVSPTRYGWNVAVTVNWRGRMVCRYAGNIRALGWSRLATSFGASYHGFPAWSLLVLAADVFASGFATSLCERQTNGGITDDEFVERGVHQ